MLKIKLEIGEFHPAIESAIVDVLPTDGVSADEVVEYVKREVLEEVTTGAKNAETVSKAREAEVKKDKVWKVNLSGTVKGIRLGDNPKGLLARLNTYLEGSREYFCRVESVTLPASVVDWVKGVHKTLTAEAAKAAKETAKV